MAILRCFGGAGIVFAFFCLVVFLGLVQLVLHSANDQSVGLESERLTSDIPLVTRCRDISSPRKAAQRQRRPSGYNVQMKCRVYEL